MKKFLTDNVSWFIVLLVLAVAAALYLAIKNRKAIAAVNSCECEAHQFTDEEIAKIKEVCQLNAGQAE